MMHMTFYWGKQATVLFDEWKTQTWLAYSLTLLAMFLFAAFHEYVVDLRSRFVKASKAKSASGLRAPLLRQRSIKYASKMIESLLFGVNAGLGYLLMLAVMSFNGGIFIAVVLGFVVGYFFFRSDGTGDETTESPCGCA